MQTNLPEGMEDAIKSAVAEHGTKAFEKALEPFVKSNSTLASYVQNLTELETKKAEIKTPKGYGFARFARALALGKGDPSRAAFVASKNWGSDDYVAKALTAGSAASAGNIIPPQFSSEFVELLRNRTIVRQIARQLPMPGGSLQMRRQTAAGTAYYVGESANATPSTQEVGYINLSAKKLVALTAATNSLLRYAGPEADAFVLEDLLSVVAIKEDYTFLFGNGEGDSPMGVYNLMDSNHQFADGGTTALQQTADYARAVRELQQDNVPVDSESGYWIMAPRTFWGIFATADASAVTYPFQAGLSQNPPRLLGFRVLVTNQVPIVGSGTALTGGAESFILFVHGPSLLLGDTLNLQVDSFDGAAYYDGSNVVSGVSRDESVIRVISEHDFNMRHNTAASTIYDVVTA